jgi:predicted dithiol-disulfide oxidoreductase (DUF899 family)
MTAPQVVSREQWLAARQELLAEEKAFTRQRDALSAARRALPWVKLERTYSFASPDGEKSLAELFGNCSQLVVYHFMFDDDWEAGCKSCSFWADNYNGITEHLLARDVRFVAVSKAPLAKLEAFKARMGWRFPWVSSPDNEFGQNYGVSFTPAQLEAGDATYNFGSSPARMGELPGLSVFSKEDNGSIYHTYSCYGRGLDILNSAYHHLDVVPRGRDEGTLSYPMEWVRLRDEYSAAG